MHAAGPTCPPNRMRRWVRGAVDRPRLWRPGGLFDQLASPEMATAMSSALECLEDAGVELQTPLKR